MSDNTGVSWSDATANAAVGCEEKSDGCKNCFAKQLAATRLKHTDRYKGLAIITPKGRAQWTGEARIIQGAMEQVVQWSRPRKIFWTAMGDPFFEKFTDQEVAAQFGAMALAPHHTFQVLTKRPERAAQLMPTLTMEACVQALYALFPTFERPTERQCRAMDEKMRAQGRDPLSYHMNTPWPLPHVWFGTSVEGPKVMVERVEALAQVPAALHWLSVEPLLDELDLGLGGVLPQSVRRGYSPVHSLIRWVVVGGESGRSARPCNIEWVRKIVKQCKFFDVPVFVKQAGAMPVESIEPTGNFRSNPITGAREYELRVQRLPLLVRNENGEMVPGKHTDINALPEDLRVQQFPEGVAT